MLSAQSISERRSPIVSRRTVACQLRKDNGQSITEIDWPFGVCAVAVGDILIDCLATALCGSAKPIVDAACAAWRKLIAQPETITSIGMRDWAHVGQPL
jgi:hypothetical protein